MKTFKLLAPVLSIVLSAVCVAPAIADDRETLEAIETGCSVLSAHARQSGLDNAQQVIPLLYKKEVLNASDPGFPFLPQYVRQLRKKLKASDVEVFRANKEFTNELSSPQSDHDKKRDLHIIGGSLQTAAQTISKRIEQELFDDKDNTQFTRPEYRIQLQYNTRLLEGSYKQQICTKPLASEQRDQYRSVETFACAIVDLTTDKTVYAIVTSGTLNRSDEDTIVELQEWELPLHFPHGLIVNKEKFEKKVIAGYQNNYLRDIAAECRNRVEKESTALPAKSAVTNDSSHYKQVPRAGWPTDAAGRYLEPKPHGHEETHDDDGNAAQNVE